MPIIRNYPFIRSVENCPKLSGDRIIIRHISLVILAEKGGGVYLKQLVIRNFFNEHYFYLLFEEVYKII
jgi:hypothetical protein